LARRILVEHEIKIGLRGLCRSRDAGHRQGATTDCSIASGLCFTCSVRTKPGHTALTRIGARSTASPRVRCSTAPPTAVDTGVFFLARCARMPLVSVIEPYYRVERFSLHSQSTSKCVELYFFGCADAEFFYTQQ
jgi:hypothetical protein